MITGEREITVAPVTLRNGQSVQAAVSASLSMDTQAISTFMALAELTSDTDTSMVDKLRICNVNEAQCSRGTGGDVVQFNSTNGGDVFKAAQTFEGDSIAYNLVSQAKLAADERDKWLDVAHKSADSNADSLMKLDEAGQILASIDSKLAKLADLASLRDDLTATGPEARSAWATLILITQRINEVPLFTTLQLVQQIGGAFAQAGVIIDQKLGEMGEKGVCKEAASAECEKSADASRRAALEQIKSDLTKVSAVLQSVLESNANAKIAPIRVQRATSELAQKEAQIRLIRRILRELGGQ